jgi:uncharacterized protein (TIGR03437 family)
LNFRHLTKAAILAVALCAPAAWAQVAKLIVVSGTGQLAGVIGDQQTFQPLVVKAVDAAGNPVSAVVITWATTDTSGVGNVTNQTSITGPDGTTYTSFWINASFVGNNGHAFDQYVVTATAPNGAAASFTETNVLRSGTGGYALVQVGDAQYGSDSVLNSMPLLGTSGAKGSTPITVNISAFGPGVPNASVRLVSNQASPSIACATAPGADTGAVLSDSRGIATCYPVFSGVGSGTFQVLTGGVAASQSDGTPVGYRISTRYTFTVTAAAPSQIQKLPGGDGQTANAGQAFANPLQAKVADASGNGVSGQQVAWTVAPAGAATASPATSTSDVNGLVSTNVTLAANAVPGSTITVTAKLAGTANVAAQTWALTVYRPPITTSSIQKVVSTDNQSAIAGAKFAQPVTVQVNGSDKKPLANFQVQFTVTSGSATLSAPNDTTDANGLAHVDVTAGNTAGAVSVTAQAGTFQTVFSLTVLPPGPTITAGSFYNAAGYQQGSISPCSLATIVAPGIAPGIQGAILPPLFGPLPLQIALGNPGTLLSITFGTSNIPAPIYTVVNLNGQQQATIQVPCDVTPGDSVKVTVNVGIATATVNIPVLAASPGIFTYVDADNVARAVLTRPDGTFVSAANPARRGEIVRAYVTGMGATTPALTTNSFPLVGVDTPVNGTVIAGITNDKGQGEGVQVTGARASWNLFGVYEVPFQVPADAAVGSNVTFSVAVIPAGSSQPIYSNGTKIAVN